jgi:hypothetical protein
MAAGLLVAGCYTGPSADHFVAVLDELNVPGGWQIAQTIVRGPDEAETCDPFLSNECPAAIRTYLTDGDIDVAYAQAAAVIAEAGFAITDEATAGCASGSSSGPTCAFFADRGDDQVYLRVFSSPGEAGLEVSVPDAAAVVIHAYSPS